MICSEVELGLGDDHDGILVLPEEAPVGSNLSKYLGDQLLDLEPTPNRPDWLSVIGVAYEISALTGEKMHEPKIDYTEADDSIADRVSVEVLAPDLCHRYTGSLIRGLKIKPSPFWMRYRLFMSGIRPINNVVDVTNYVMLEYGQPLHAFDYDTLFNHKVVVRRAEKGERLKTLDGEDRLLTDTQLVIADDRSPKGLAGVIGGLDSEITINTNDVFLEAASFDPGNNRRTSQKYRVKTEASLRFEKGIRLNLPLFGLRRATQIIQQITGGTISKGIIDINQKGCRIPTVTLSAERLSKILGVKIPIKKAANALTALGFNCSNLKSSHLTAEAPYWRSDIVIEDDLIEEIIRIYGYENLPTTNLAGALPDPIENPLSMLRDNSRVIVSGLGFQEILTYTLTSKEDLERVNNPNDKVRLEPLSVSNPVASQHTWLRTSLRSSLLRTFADNRKHQDQALRLFEIGVEFLPVAENLPEERPVMCAVLGGGRLERWTRPETEKLDFFDAKGVLEVLLLSQGVDVRFTDVDVSPLKTGFAAEAVATKTDETVALVGQIDETVTGFFDIDEPVYLIEFWLSKAVHALNSRPEYSPPPRYPDARHDLAIIVPENVPSGDIVAFVCAHRSGDVLCEAELFDEYRGAGLPPNMKSLGLAVRYRSRNRTLKDKDVLKCRKSLLNRLEKEYGAVLRN